NNPGRLNPEEFALLRQHPSIGRRILEGVRGFQPYLPIVELHHENWDGTGYPLHLAQTQVPLSARIVHVADAYDAMTSARPYRAALSHEFAIRELQAFAGTQFDPEIVHVFVSSTEILNLASSGMDAWANSGAVYMSAGSNPGGSEKEPV
ncbi:MAG: HD-GYP domain-containing protein, partial [Candidatus Acidiferrales bacterium]